MHTTLLRTVTFLLAVLLLVACTRDRETPTPTPESTAPATTAAGQPANQTGSTTTTVRSSDEPVVESTAGTPTPAATAEETPTPEATAADTFDYTVKPGETLAGIAGKFQTEVQTLRELNFLLDDNIFAGQVLSVPYVEGMTAEGAPTPSPTPFTYVVEVGDTLSSISARFNVRSGTLIEVNNILDANNLAVGTPLLIPGYVNPAGDSAGSTADTSDGTQTGAADSTAGGGASGAAVEHVVQPGESLGQIAAEYGVDPVALADANNITNGNLIRVGQRLVIPGITARDALEARGERHIVQSGESLSMIAAQYGVSIEAIMAANSLDDPNTIVVGQELLIPPSQ